MNGIRNIKKARSSKALSTNNKLNNRIFTSKILLILCRNFFFIYRDLAEMNWERGVEAAIEKARLSFYLKNAKNY